MKILILTLTIFVIAGCSSKEKTSPPPPAKNVAAQSTEEKGENSDGKLLKNQQAGPQWSYQGESGPENWGQLDKAFHLCSRGRHQSPINLKWKKPISDGKLYFSYGPSKSSILDNGHQIRVAFEPGNKLSLRGSEYELVNIDFHSSSEHTLSGTQLPVEIQFVHKNSKGQTAIVSVFAIEGQANSTIEYLWKHLPKKKLEKIDLTDALVNPLALIPAKLTYYNYEGSLTTPPCTEGVDWNVLNTPITLSRDQILKLRKIYDENNRPTQKINGRTVTNY